MRHFVNSDLDQSALILSVQENLDSRCLNRQIESKIDFIKCQSVVELLWMDNTVTCTSIRIGIDWNWLETLRNWNLNSNALTSVLFGYQTMPQQWHSKFEFQCKRRSTQLIESFHSKPIEKVGLPPKRSRPISLRSLVLYLLSTT